MDGISLFTGRARTWFVARLGIASLAVFLPIAIVALIVFHSFHADLNATRLGRTQVSQLRLIDDVSEAVNRFRDAVIAHDARADDAARFVDDRLNRLDASLRRTGMSAPDSWTRLHAAWTTVRAHRSTARVDRLVDLTDQSVVDLANAMVLANDRSSGVRTLLSIDAVRMPTLTASLHRLDGELVQKLAKRSLTFQERVRAATIVSQMRTIFGTLVDEFGQAGRAEPSVSAAASNGVHRFENVLDPYLSTIDGIVEDDAWTSRSGEVDALRAKQNAISDASSALTQHTADLLDGLLLRRSSKQTRDFMLVQAAIVFAVCMGLWFLLRFAQDMRRRANEIEKLERAEQDRRGEQLRAHNAERALAVSSMMFRTIFERAPLGIATIDSAGGIFEWNQEIERFLDHRKDSLVVDNRTELLDVIERRKPSLEFERSFVGLDGQTKWAHILIAPYSKDGDRMAICMLQNITGRKDAELRLQHEATHDGLTGLANRKLFRSKLSEATSVGEDGGGNFAILFIDLDLFKFVNDTYGHAAGDVVLTTVADRLRKLVTPRDVVARFGGDEFAILVMAPCSLTQGERLAQAIATSVAEPIPWEEHMVNIGSSVGLAFGPGRYQQAEDLMRNADTAMYAAKAAGRGRYVVFDPAMQEAAHQRAQLSNDLQLALGDQGQIHLLYQPIVNVEHNEIMGFEALVRWKHPVLGEITPDEFVKVAEQSGAIRSLGRYVMRQACSQLMAMAERLPSTARLTLSVNISPSELSAPDFVESVAGVIRTTDFDPGRLYLEITESSMIVSGEQANRIMSRLREFGIRISIDDFGAGYSSLRYLQELQIDLLKIDRGFLRGSSTESSGRTILRAIVSLASSFDLPVVAEGIETPEQLRLVRSLGCQYAQGLLWGRPMPLADIEARLSGRPAQSST